MTPALHPSSRTAKDTVGTGISSGQICTFTPLAAKTRAATLEKSSLLMRLSKPMATEGVRKCSFR